MDIQGTEIISAPREKVWEFVTDAESVASCTPGVKSVRILEPGRRFEVVGGIKLGTVGLNAKNVIEFTDLVELEEARLHMHQHRPGQPGGVGTGGNGIEALRPLLDREHNLTGCPGSSHFSSGFTIRSGTTRAGPRHQSQGQEQSRYEGLTAGRP